MLNDFIDLFFPRLCTACSANLYKNEHCICLKCHIDIPKTNFHLDEDNPVAQLFWGRVNITYATAYYFYNKGSRFQSLIHKLKYKNQPEIGHELGKKLAYQLKESILFANIEIVIPVPLHPVKQKQRGYNQSLGIALEIAKAFEAECVSDNLIRLNESASQTNRSRYERFENVNEIFNIKNPEQFINKNILLVDDVVTTGSTLEACASCLLKISNTIVNVACLAVAK